MKKLIAALLIGLLPSTVMAQQVLPKWHMKGNEACYGFEDAKLLLELDSELLMHREIAPQLQRINLDLYLAVDEFKAALETQKAATAVVVDNNQQLDKMLKDAIQRANKAESNKMPGLGWTIAGALVLVLTGVALERFVIQRAEGQ